MQKWCELVEVLQKPFRKKVQVDDSVNKVCDCDMGNLNPDIDPIAAITIPITKAISFIRNSKFREHRMGWDPVRPSWWAMW